MGRLFQETWGGVSYIADEWVNSGLCSRKPGRGIREFPLRLGGAVPGHRHGPLPDRGPRHSAEPRRRPAETPRRRAEPRKSPREMGCNQPHDKMEAWSPKGVLDLQKETLGTMN